MVGYVERFEALVGVSGIAWTDAAKGKAPILIRIGSRSKEECERIGWTSGKAPERI